MRILATGSMVGSRSLKNVVLELGNVLVELNMTEAGGSPQKSQKHDNHVALTLPGVDDFPNYTLETAGLFMVEGVPADLALAVQQVGDRIPMRVITYTLWLN